MRQGFKRSGFWIDLILKNWPMTIAGPLENTHTQRDEEEPTEKQKAQWCRRAQQTWANKARQSRRRRFDYESVDSLRMNFLGVRMCMQNSGPRLMQGHPNSRYLFVLKLIELGKVRVLVKPARSPGFGP